MIIPTPERTHIPEVKVFIDGEELYDLHIQYIKLQQRINTMEKAELHIREDLNEENPLSIFNSNLFKEGRTISIHLVYKDIGKVTFDGIIDLQKIKYDTQGYTNIEITSLGSNPVVSYHTHSLSSIPLSSMPPLRFGSDIDSFSLQINTDPNSNRLDWLSGYLEIKGSVDTKVNTRVNLTGFGPRISSEAYVIGVKHLFEKSKWVTIIDLGCYETIVS